MSDRLYEQDFYSWVRQQSSLLRQGQFDQLDVSHLVEEIDDLGNRHYDQLESRLTQLTAHLLKWRHWCSPVQFQKSLIP